MNCKTCEYFVSLSEQSFDWTDGEESGICENCMSDRFHQLVNCDYECDFYKYRTTHDL